MKYTLTLSRIAHARSGDKGSAANIGVWAKKPDFWPHLLTVLTADIVEDYFRGWCSAVTRFELPNLYALNFVLHDGLDGGGSRSLHPDAQGKALGVALLRLAIPASFELAHRLEGGQSNDNALSQR